MSRHVLPVVRPHGCKRSVACQDWAVCCSCKLRDTAHMVSVLMRDQNKIKVTSRQLPAG